MEKINEQVLKTTYGGGFSWAIFFSSLIGAGAFIIGVVEGYLRPQVCRS